MDTNTYILQLASVAPLWGMIVAPIAVIATIAVAASATAALTPRFVPGVGSFIRQGFMSAIGMLPKRKQTWGTVYDANTKKPIPFAQVQLLSPNRRVLETRVADEQGRYGFLTTPESLITQHVTISLLPRHVGYVFPSKTPVSIDSFVYNNLYYGDSLQVNDQQLINFDIPMDPLKPSSAPLMMKSPSIALGAGVAAIADAGFWLGAVMVPLGFLLAPSPFTFGTVCLFLGAASLRLFGISEHPYGTVVDVTTGHAMPFALITLNDSAGKRVAFAVSDERGRYFIVTERGKYELSVFTPSTITPPRRRVVPIHAQKGWVTHELKV